MAPGSWPSGSPRSFSVAEGRRRWPQGSFPYSSRVPAWDVRGAPEAGGLHPDSGYRRHPRVLPQEGLLAALHPLSKSPCANCPTKSRRGQHAKSVAEVVLSHDFPGTTLPRNLDGTTQVTGKEDGGAEGNRTLDLLNAIQALSQLSYGPRPHKAA